jgi:hypothetical protein
LRQTYLQSLNIYGQNSHEKRVREKPVRNKHDYGENAKLADGTKGDGRHKTKDNNI